MTEDDLENRVVLFSSTGKYALESIAAQLYWHTPFVMPCELVELELDEAERDTGLRAISGPYFRRARGLLGPRVLALIDDMWGDWFQEWGGEICLRLLPFRLFRKICPGDKP